jgi:hypothetical protein
MRLGSERAPHARISSEPKVQFLCIDSTASSGYPGQPRERAHGSTDRNSAGGWHAGAAFLKGGPFRTQQRVQVRGCSPAEWFRELGSVLHDEFSLARIAALRMGPALDACDFLFTDRANALARGPGVRARTAPFGTGLARCWALLPGAVRYPPARRMAARGRPSVKALALGSAAPRGRRACCTAGSADRPRPAPGRCTRRPALPRARRASPR